MAQLPQQFVSRIVGSEHRFDGVAQRRDELSVVDIGQSRDTQTDSPQFASRVGSRFFDPQVIVIAKFVTGCEQVSVELCADRVVAVRWCRQRWHERVGTHRLTDDPASRFAECPMDNGPNPGDHFDSLEHVQRLDRRLSLRLGLVAGIAAELGLHRWWDANDQLHRHEFAEIRFQPCVVMDDPRIGIEQLQELDRSFDFRQSHAADQQHDQADCRDDRVMSGDPTPDTCPPIRQAALCRPACRWNLPCCR